MQVIVLRWENMTSPPTITSTWVSTFPADAGFRLALSLKYRLLNDWLRASLLSMDREFKSTTMIGRFRVVSLTRLLLAHTNRVNLDSHSFSGARSRRHMEFSPTGA
jgi:hypothetical protein